jgi:hypothetical protein
LALFSGPLYHERPQGQLSVEFLVQKGYPAKLLQFVFTNATSTIAEAKDLRAELIRRKAKRVLLVTASYHSRRAKLLMTLFCPGVKFMSIPAPDPNYHVRNGGTTTVLEVLCFGMEQNAGDSVVQLSDICSCPAVWARLWSVNLTGDEAG